MADDFRDHGEQPESSRVWLIAAGGAVLPRGQVAPEQPTHLADIAPSVRALLLLPPAWMAVK